ncbi:MAG: TetR family transcriptional regulator [Solirubrobacteraceae bacterium]
MAWDTERTRRRLKTAAVAEFAEHGFAGTKMTRIAARAGLNKERLYSYFGNKRALWEQVLTDELDALATAVEVRGVGLDDVGEFAGATYDYHADHPQLARLLQWEGLMGGPAAGAETRATHYREKVARFAQAQESGALTADLDAAHLVFALIALAAWWQTVPQLAELITGADNANSTERLCRRAFVVAAAQRLAAAP